MMVAENNHPYIIAYGSSKRDISKFYIEIEKNLMMVSIHISNKLDTECKKMNANELIYYSIILFRCPMDSVSWKRLTCFSKSIRFSTSNLK